MSQVEGTERRPRYRRKDRRKRGKQDERGGQKRGEQCRWEKECNIRRKGREEGNIRGCKD